MNNKDKKMLRRYVFTLALTPYVRLKLIYLAQKYYYLNELGIKIALASLIPNEIDREIAKPYIDSCNKLSNQDFIIVYTTTCKVYAERTNKLK